MYSVNGVDLPSSQYKELRALVRLKSDEKRAAFSNRALHPHKNKDLWNPSGVDLYKALYKKGLIDGSSVDRCFLFDGVVTQAGIDFVHDVRKVKRREWFRSYLPSIIAALLGVGGTIAGVLLGWHLGTL